MDLQENIQRIQEMMGIISEDKSSYTVAQIKKGLTKSEKDNDVTINTSIDNIINNIDKFEFQIGSVEAFLDDENSFTSDALVDKLISYVKDKELNIDISKLNIPPSYGVPTGPKITASHSNKLSLSSILLLTFEIHNLLFKLILLKLLSFRLKKIL